MTLTMLFLFCQHILKSISYLGSASYQSLVLVVSEVA